MGLVSVEAERCGGEKFGNVACLALKRSAA